jgi:taurine dioxygenase
MVQTAPPPTKLDVRRVAGNIGAEIRGLDISAGINDATMAAVRQAILHHKVVYLRGQQLDYDAQVAFGRRLGELTQGHPIFPPPAERPFLREIDSRQGTRANHWHTDLTFLDRPPAFAILHAIVIPPVGGDTMWANGASAYLSLPPELRDLADRLRIVHSNDCDYIDATMPDGRTGYIATRFETEHPAVRVHPETGERSLMVGGFATRVAGFSPSASRDILRTLQDHAIAPEQTVRWSWSVGDLVIWDNRSTQHYAIYDYGTEHRRCERVTVAGDVPVGVDGRPAVVLAGESSSYTGE